jgi:hypothetical protein
MTETTTPTYLPLARAAHVQGNVILMANFAQDGSVESLQVVSGPVMLQSGAVDFVKGWKANLYTGPRTCPVVVSYMFATDSADKVQQGRRDPQHFVVVGQPPPCLCDPSAVLGRKRKRFGIF